MSIVISNSFEPNVKNTPLDIRSVVATIGDLEGMINPCVGGIVFCKANSTHYRILSLKSIWVGPREIKNAAVDEYAPLNGVDTRNEMPAASSGTVGLAYIYVGTTTSLFTKGHLYMGSSKEVEHDGGSTSTEYYWEDLTQEVLDGKLNKPSTDGTEGDVLYFVNSSTTKWDEPKIYWCETSEEA